jgi:hypothetical protein
MLGNAMYFLAIFAKRNFLASFATSKQEEQLSNQEEQLSNQPRKKLPLQKVSGSDL